MGEAERPKERVRLSQIAADLVNHVESKPRVNRRDGFSQLSVLQKLDCLKQSSWKYADRESGFLRLRTCFDDAAINFAG
jgi:hypothetical protein